MLKHFSIFHSLHWNLDFWITWKPRWSDSPDDALLCGNYRLSSHCPREKGLEPAAATGLSTAYRPGLSLCRSFTSTPGTYLWVRDPGLLLQILQKYIETSFRMATKMYLSFSISLQNKYLLLGWRGNWFTWFYCLMHYYNSDVVIF